MNIEIKKSFSKDIDKIHDKKLLNAISETIDHIKQVKSIKEIKHIKKWRVQKSTTG
jgi:hypothetical protein